MPSCRSLLMHSAISARLALVVAGVIIAVPVQAQQDSDEPISQPIVQATPNSDSMNLNEALTRLGRNPRDSQALIDAGQAALAIGDVDAAVGFFSRADQVSPGSAQVKAGLARALVRNGNPFDAIPLFDEAERVGPLDSTVALDRGLAYDLVADNASAQRYYRQALAAGPNDEATRRLAISLAISGDKRGAGTTLSPLLTRQDMAAWRSRAFSLAILGQADEAISVVNGTLPPALATGIAPYLRYMPRLTPAQQAAAANFGQFPRASEIGQDDPRVARYATTSARRTGLASADAGLIPRGEPLGRSSRRGREERDASRDTRTNNTRERPPEVALASGTSDPKVRRVYDTSGFPAYVPPTPATAPALTPPPRPNPPLAAAQPPAVRLAPQPAPPVAARPVLPPPAPPVPARVAVAQPATSPAIRPAAAPVMQPVPAGRPVIAMASVPTPTPQAALPQRATAPAVTAQPPVVAVSAPAPAPTIPPVAVAPPRPPVAAAPIVRTPPSAPSAPVPPVPRRQSLSDAFSDLARPSADIAPAAGAVDIRRIRPTRQVAPGLTPEVPKVPSRIWVQLATGRDKAALGYDWRRMARQAEAIFKGKRPLTSSWGQTNRLLTGPFESEAAANSFLAQLRRGDIDGAFMWTSPAGQVVDALPGR